MGCLRSIILVINLLASKMTAAAPLDATIQQRGAPRVTIYQEVLQIVGQVSTVYVDPLPAAPTPNQAVETPTSSAAATITTTSLKQPAAAADIETVDIAYLPSVGTDTAQTDAAESENVDMDTKDSLAGTLHDVDSSSDYSGEATYYSTGMGSCGIESDDSQDVVALSPEIMQTASTGNPNSNRLCGKKIEIEHPKTGDIIKATVVDTCPGCDKNDIDLSPACFKKLAELADGKISVSWKIV